MKKQSSIEWFFDELKRLNVTVPSESAIELLESYKKTKEMHKQEIIEAHYDWNRIIDKLPSRSAEEYYNKTFETE